jgi:ribonucleoside-diphosphate reductase alpha chain
MSTKYAKLSVERKELQSQGVLPDWFITGGYQLFKEKYDYSTSGQSFKGQIERIAMTAASHLPKDKYEEGAKWFFDLLWKGWLSASTPVLSNTGTKRGLPVSCAANVIEDSVDGFYSALREVACLTKAGFGTASYMGDIRPRGSVISDGNKASGLVPVFEDFVRMSQKVTQGTRRGAWAGYVPMEHGDFFELCDWIAANPDNANVGWNISDEFNKRLNEGDFDADARYKRAMKLKMVTGKGYFCFIDKANRQVPEMYKKHGLTVKSFQLCNEVSLFSDENHTYTCILSSMNLSKYDEWKNTDAVFWSTVFLDCICEEFLTKARTIAGLEKAVRFTEKGRALGLGQCGLHSYMQDNMIAFDSLDAQFKMLEMSKHIEEESLRASQWLAQELGEPEWCKGFGVRNTHRTTCPPTKSTALIMGGISEGINPFPANTFSQKTAGGEVDRINPSLVNLMKKKGIFTREHIEEVVDTGGSVQSVNWLTDDEKKVFKTAFEINQNVLVRYAALRNKHICQWQSVNLFIPSDTPEEVISELHEDMFNNEDVLGSYYIYSQSGYKHQSVIQCEACQ